MPLWIKGLMGLSGGRLESLAVRALLEAGYVDVFRKLRPSDAGFTFPSFSPHIRYDYAFASFPLGERLVDCKVIAGPAAASRASDHLALLTVLSC